MADLIPEGVSTILEPSRGLGNIVRELESRDYDVTAPIDFFLMKKRRFDCVVMNPPFSDKSCRMENAPPGLKGMKTGYHFLEEAMEMSDNVIALMTWFTMIDSDVRVRKLKAFGLKSITALPRKTFQYTRIQTCILELNKGYSGPTEYKVFEF